MSPLEHPQTSVFSGPPLLVGVDVGGTFTDLVSWDGEKLAVVKVASTPPDFHQAVIEAVGRARGDSAIQVVHGSTVATNALLQRGGEPIAFVTTEGFRDMLLIGRQNRPELYALRVRRTPPIAPSENCFTIRERIDAAGEIVTPLEDAEIDRLITELQGRGLRHVAVCLLFSFVNAEHETRLARRLTEAGFTVSLSSDLVPEFREYERASTTAINASLRPTVESYLTSLQSGLNCEPLRIMASAGGTLSVPEAAKHAARLVLSGPAGGVLGAAFVARAAGLADVITYDMGGTSTDVATVLGGAPQWTTSSTVDGLPLALPMFDIHTVGAGGGSIAYLDDGGALRVGPRSAGALPGPACYGRGGSEPTVTDANLVLGRILADQFLGGAMRVDVELARAAIERLARQMGKDVIAAALGIVRVAEANMAAAVRAATSRRGHDPRQFALVSFGGAGGLHACALAESLDIPRVLVPPYAGVLSALGMVVAPPVVDASQTVVHLGAGLDDHRLVAEYGRLAGRTSDVVLYEQTASTEAYADVRFRGQSYELTVRVLRPSIDHVREEFLRAYAAQYGRAPEHREIEIVTVRFRRYGRGANVTLPAIEPAGSSEPTTVTLVDGSGGEVHAVRIDRAGLISHGELPGPALLIDPHATTYVPAGWRAKASNDGIVTLTRSESP